MMCGTDLVAHDVNTLHRPVRIARTPQQMRKSVDHVVVDVVGCPVNVEVEVGALLYFAQAEQVRNDGEC